MERTNSSQPDGARIPEEQAPLIPTMDTRSRRELMTTIGIGTVGAHNRVRLRWRGLRVLAVFDGRLLGGGNGAAVLRR